MGYTQYLSNKPAFTNEQWTAFTADAKKLLALASTKVPLANRFGEAGTKPEFNSAWIGFNGVDEDSHESAVVHKSASAFEFCKTARKPYDEVVVAFYKLIRKYLPTVKLSSDGGNIVFGTSKLP